MSTPQDRIPAPSDATSVNRQRERDPNVGWREFVRQFIPEAIRDVVLPSTEAQREFRERRRIDETIPYDRRFPHRSEARENEIDRLFEMERAGFEPIEDTGPKNFVDRAYQGLVPPDVREIIDESLSRPFKESMGSVSDRLRYPALSPIVDVFGGKPTKQVLKGISDISGATGLVTGESPFEFIDGPGKAATTFGLLNKFKNKNVKLDDLMKAVTSGTISEDQGLKFFNTVMPDAHPTSFGNLRKLYSQGVGIEDLEKATGLTGWDVGETGIGFWHEDILIQPSKSGFLVTGGEGKLFKNLDEVTEHLQKMGKIPESAVKPSASVVGKKSTAVLTGFTPEKLGDFTGTKWVVSGPKGKTITTTLPDGSEIKIRNAGGEYTVIVDGKSTYHYGIHKLGPKLDEILASKGGLPEVAQKADELFITVYGDTDIKLDDNGYYYILDKEGKQAQGTAGFSSWDDVTKWIDNTSPKKTNELVPMTHKSNAYSYDNFTIELENGKWVVRKEGGAIYGTVDSLEEAKKAIDTNTFNKATTKPKDPFGGDIPEGLEVAVDKKAWNYKGATIEWDDANWMFRVMKVGENPYYVGALQEAKDALDGVKHLNKLPPSISGASKEMWTYGNNVIEKLEDGTFVLKHYDDSFEEVFDTMEEMTHYIDILDESKKVKAISKSKYGLPDVPMGQGIDYTDHTILHGTDGKFHVLDKNSHEIVPDGHALDTVDEAHEVVWNHENSIPVEKASKYALEIPTTYSDYDYTYGPYEIIKNTFDDTFIVYKKGTSANLTMQVGVTNDINKLIEKIDTFEDAGGYVPTNMYEQYKNFILESDGLPAGGIIIKDLAGNTIDGPFVGFQAAKKAADKLPATSNTFGKHKHHIKWDENNFEWIVVDESGKSVVHGFPNSAAAQKYADKINNSKSKYEHLEFTKETLSTKTGLKFNESIFTDKKSSIGYNANMPDGTWVNVNYNKDVNIYSFGTSDGLHGEGAITSLDELLVKLDAVYKAKGGITKPKTKPNRSVPKIEPVPTQLGSTKLLTRPEYQILDDTFANTEKLPPPPGQTGSNDGDWFLTPEGVKFYGKFPHDPNHARVEFLTNRLYNQYSAWGEPAPTAYLFNAERGSGIGHASVDVGGEWKSLPKDADKAMELISAEAARKFLRNAHLDILFANWDVVSYNFTNVLTNGSDLKRIDNGGSLLYRARGDLKTSKILDEELDMIDVDWDKFKTNRGYGAIMDRAGIESFDDLGRHFMNSVNDLPTDWAYDVETFLPNWTGPEKDRVIQMLNARTAALKEKVKDLPKRRLLNLIEEDKNLQVSNYYGDNLPEWQRIFKLDVPRDSWDSSDETRRLFNKYIDRVAEQDGDFESLRNMLNGWFGSSRETRGSIAKMVGVGESTYKGGYDLDRGARVLVESIARETPTSPDLWRGRHITNQTRVNFFNNLRVGDEFDLIPASFSSELDKADSFARGGTLNVIFELEPDSRALKVSNLSTHSEYEWITGGVMEIMDIKDTMNHVGDPLKIFRIRQKEVYNVKNP